jgi:hypothetical protein
MAPTGQGRVSRAQQPALFASQAKSWRTFLDQVLVSWDWMGQSIPCAAANVGGGGAGVGVTGAGEGGGGCEVRGQDWAQGGRVGIGGGDDAGPGDWDCARREGLRRGGCGQDAVLRWVQRADAAWGWLQGDVPDLLQGDRLPGKPPPPAHKSSYPSRLHEELSAQRKQHARGGPGRPSGRLAPQESKRKGSLPDVPATRLCQQMGGAVARVRAAGQGGLAPVLRGVAEARRHASVSVCGQPLLQGPISCSMRVRVTLLLDSILTKQ